jgi:hypothetical protein
MKHAELRACAHNVADSLASGIGLMIGHYNMDVFGEASRSPGGAITVDFLGGLVVEGEASEPLQEAVGLYRAAFSNLCGLAGGSVRDVVEAKARFWQTPIGRRFTVSVADTAGRSSTTEYAGVPGRRVKVLDGLGRVRRKPHSRRPQEPA